FALLLVVLDDAVVDQGQLAMADVRVGVGLGHAAMGGPAGVADAQHAVEVLGGGGMLHLRHAAGAAHPADAPGLDHGQAGRVIAAVFQALESLDQDRNHIAIRDRANNAAHAVFPRVTGPRFYRSVRSDRRNAPAERWRPAS